MAVTKFIESGSSATQGFEFFSGTDMGTGGAVTSDAQAVLGSVRSIKCTNGASNTWGGVYVLGIMADAGRRVSFGFRFTGTPNPSNGGSPFLGVGGGGHFQFFIGINTSNKLVLMDDAGTTLATGTTVLTTSTDYRISFAYTITSTTINTITIFLNGNSEIAASNVTLLFTGSDQINFEWAAGTPTAGANMIAYFAHIFIDDGTSGDPGNIRVTAKLPIANGTTNGMTSTGTPSGTGSGNARFVNERPINTSNFVSVVAAGSAITEEYNLQTVSQGDVDITGATIVDYTGWLYAKALLSETGKIIVNNVQTNISLVNANTLFTKIAASSTYPAGTGTDIGIVTATTATTVSLYEAGIIIAYIPAAAGFGTVTLGYKTLLGIGG